MVMVVILVNANIYDVCSTRRDTASQERFQALSVPYYRRAQVSIDVKEGVA